MKIFAFAAFFAFCSWAAESSASSAVASYPGTWQEPPASVLITLGRNSITGCGEVYSRASAAIPGDYLAYCTADGENWTAWFVRTDSGTVTNSGILDGMPTPYDEQK